MPVVLISGGTGLIGKKLTSHLIDRNFEVIILSRNKRNIPDNPKISYSFWDIEKQQMDSSVLQKIDYIIHLAGAGVMDRKWTNSYKEEILNSRTKSGSLLIKNLREHASRVKAFVTASAIGWYGADANPLVHKEGFYETDPADKSFLGETCLKWENSVDEATELNIRVVKFRTGIVLSDEGGAFKEFMKPLKFGIAGIMGDGKQVISWIHIEDLCRMYIEALENTELKDVYNAVAPAPVSQKKLMIETANKIRNKFYIPIHIPVFFLKLILGKRSIEILKSATVSNKKIKSAGFTFLFPSIESALDDLVTRQGAGKKI
jgi:uncharacterized protein (TIGR01777 family)